MKLERAKVIDVLKITKQFQNEFEDLNKPPEEGSVCLSNGVLTCSLTKGTRGYIEKTVNQINNTYEKGCYDACATMIRRLVETLIIETFETYSIENKIKDKNGDFFYLGDLFLRYHVRNKLEGFKYITK